VSHATDAVGTLRLRYRAGGRSGKRSAAIHISSRALVTSPSEAMRQGQIALLW